MRNALRCRTACACVLLAALLILQPAQTAFGQIIDPNAVEGQCYGGCESFDAPETSIWDEDGDGSIWDDTSGSYDDDSDGYGGYDNSYEYEQPSYQPSAEDLTKQRAYAINQEGVDFYNQGRFAEAEERFRAALNESPGDPKIRKNLAHSLEAQGNDAMDLRDYARAISFYEQARALLPDDPEILNMIRVAKGTWENSQGVQSAYLGDHETAVQHYEAALQYIPNDPVILANLQDSRESLGEQKRVLNVEQKEQELSNLIAGISQSLAQEGAFHGTLPETGAVDGSGLGGLDFMGASQPAAATGASTQTVANLPDQVDCRSTDPGVVNLCDLAMADMKVDPVLFDAVSPSLKISKVPSPSEAPPMTWERYVRSTPAELILEALGKGEGNLDTSIHYLDEWIRQHPNHRAESALSYLEGLKTSFIAANADWKRQGGGTATIVNDHLLAAVVGWRRWPGEKRSEGSDAILPNELDWRNQRTTKMLEAIDQGGGDLMDSFEILENDQEDTLTAANAHRYLQGVYAYWDFLESQGEQ